MTIEPALGLFLDSVIVVLLLAVMVAGFFLNRRIDGLKKSAANFGRLSGGFDKAIQRAQMGVNALRAAAEDSGEELQEQIRSARRLRDELRLLATAGASPRLAARPGAAKSGAAKSGVAKSGVAESGLANVRAAQPRPPLSAPSEAELELTEALRHVR